MKPIPFSFRYFKNFQMSPGSPRSIIDPALDLHLPQAFMQRAHNSAFFAFKMRITNPCFISILYTRNGIIGDARKSLIQRDLEPSESVILDKDHALEPGLIC